MGDKSAKSYNADEVTVSIGETLIDSGYADGEFLRIEQEAEDFLDVVGSDGEVAVSRTNDRRATITLILMQTSAGNDILAALRETAIRGVGLAGAVSLYVRDRNGRAVFKADTCWIQRPPDATFDRTATPREWTLRTNNLVRFDGGNRVA